MKMLRILALLAAGIAVGVCPLNSYARKVTGSVSGDEFMYLTDFCVDDAGDDPVEPMGSGDFQVDTDQQALEIYTYNDSKQSFPAAKNLDCAEATGKTPQYYTVKTTVAAGGSSFHYDFWGTSGPTFYYFLAATQGCADNVDIKSMTIHLRNDGSELSCNEQGIPGAMTFFAISWILGTVTYILVHLKKKTMDRIFVRAYVGTFVCRSLGLLFLTIYWLYYESSGYQKSPLEDVGRMFYVVSHISLWTTNILVAEGLFGTSDNMTSKDYDASALALIVGCLVLILYLALAAWYEFQHQPYSTRYVYDTRIGVAISIIVLLLGLWFLYRMWKQYGESTYSRKMKKYLKMLAAMLFPTFVIPLANMAVGDASPSWRRKNTVAVFDLLMVTLTGALVIAVTWPTRQVFADPSEDEDDDEDSEGNQPQEQARKPLIPASDQDEWNQEDNDEDTEFNPNEAIGDEQL